MIIFEPNLEQCAANPCEIHQHDTRIDPRDAVERMTRKAAVPADLGDLVLRSHRCQLRAVEGLQHSPDIVHGSQEQHISVHVQQ